jgi:hypothetical protein
MNFVLASAKDGRGIARNVVEGHSEAKPRTAWPCPPRQGAAHIRYLIR